MMKRVSPGLDSTRMLPWCFWATMRQARSSPSPVPSPKALVVKNGVKMRSAMSGGMPGPSSQISTLIASSPTAEVRMVSVPWPPIAWIALSMMLVHTWLRSPG